MGKREVLVLFVARTAIGTCGGTLKDVPLSQLATTAVSGALQRSGVAASDIGHVVLVNVIPTEPRDAYLSRVAVIESGMPDETPAFNVNQLCGSGLQAVVSAAQALLLGDKKLSTAGKLPIRQVRFWAIVVVDPSLARASPQKPGRTSLQSSFGIDRYQRAESRKLSVCSRSRRSRRPRHHSKSAKTRG